MSTDTHKPPTLTALGHAITDLAYASTHDLPCAEVLLRRVLRCYAAWARAEAVGCALETAQQRGEGERVGTG